ncbi:hypothetical protein [Actinophytocola sediminis]
MREVSCRDGAGREKKFRIFISAQHDVVLAAPPGEVAILEPRVIDAMKQGLTDAQIEAIRRRGAW